MINCYTYTYIDGKKQAEITVFKTLYGWHAVSKYGILWNEKEQTLKDIIETRIKSYWQAEELCTKFKKKEKDFKESKNDRNRN